MRRLPSSWRAVLSRRATITAGVVLEIILAVVTYAARGGAGAVVSGSLLVVVTSAPLLARLRVDPLDAPGLYGLSCALFFGLTSLAWVGHPPIPGPSIDQGDIARALLVTASAVAAFAAGTWLGGRHPRKAGTDQLRAAPSVAVLVGVFGVGAVALLVGLATDTVGYSTGAQATAHRSSAIAQPLNAVASIAPVVVAATALAYFASGDRSLRRPLIALIVAQTGLGFAAGFKGQTIYPVVLTLAAFVLVKQRIPWRLIAVTALAVLALVVPANAVYRTARQQAQTSNTTTPHALRTLSRDEVLTSAKTSYDHALFYRLRYIDHVALIVALTPSVYGYGDGSHYALLPLLAVVPRALWPDKPILDEGLRFAHTYWQIPVTTRTAQPLTQAGDLYRNFGIWGTLVGMLLWGTLVAMLTRLARHSRSLRVQMVYIYATTAWLAGLALESDLPYLVVTATTALPVVFAVAWFVLPGRSGVPGYLSLIRTAQQVVSRRRQPPVAASESHSGSQAGRDP